MSLEGKVRKYIHVDGIVQGVGFRWFASRAAADCHLTGWVRNLGDGSVELEVQGFPEDLDLFVGRLLRGRGLIRVTSYEGKKLAPVHELDFRIR